MVWWLYYITLGFLLVRLGVVVYNLISKPYLQKTQSTDPCRLSLLVPMRNEEDNVYPLLQSLGQQQEDVFEVIVLDDGSTDNTLALLEASQTEYPFLQIVRGEPLPPGWLGKNWACHQLAEHARGDHFLFIDADVRLQPGAIPAALAEMQAKGLQLLSIFPDQELHSLGEKLVVPLMHYLLLGLLPVRLVYNSRNHAFAAANGQFLLFEAGNYRQQRWHSRLRAQVTEDIEAVRLMKKEGYKCLTLLGHGLVYCHMYDSYDAAVDGFAKNMYAGFGHNPFLAFFYFFFSLLVYVPLLLYLPITQLLYLLILVAIYESAITYMSGQRICLRQMWWLHPLRMLVFLYIIGLSVYRHYSHTNQWKGRNIHI